MSGSDREPKQPRHGARAKAGKAGREARLAQAMRDNLRKRKRQLQEREGEDARGGVKHS